MNPIINEIESTDIPPTYFKLNKFTYGFQQLIDAYGIASYQEINPGKFLKHQILQNKSKIYDVCLLSLLGLITKKF